MPPPASQLILHQVSRFLLPLGMHPYPCHPQGPAPALPAGLSTLVEGPAPAPSGHLPVSKQHRVCQHLRREVDGDALFLRPFILVLGSPSRVRHGLGMRGPPPASHMAPVTSDDW